MTLGPPALVFNWPETASMASRISSACNRRRSNRQRDRKSTRLNSSHGYISYAVFCLKKKKHTSELQSRLHLVCRLLLEKKKLTLWILNINKSPASTSRCMTNKSTDEITV